MGQAGNMMVSSQVSSTSETHLVYNNMLMPSLKNTAGVFKNVLRHYILLPCLLFVKSKSSCSVRHKHSTWSLLPDQANTNNNNNGHSNNSNHH